MANLAMDGFIEEVQRRIKDMPEELEQQCGCNGELHFACKPDKVSEPDWKSIAYLYSGFLSGIEMRARAVAQHTIANDIAALLKNSSIEQIAALYKDR